MKHIGTIGTELYLERNGIVKHVLSFLPNLINKLIKKITESLKIKINTCNCLCNSVKRPTFAELHLDIELYTNQQCLQLNLELTQS